MPKCPLVCICEGTDGIIETGNLYTSLKINLISRNEAQPTKNMVISKEMKMKLSHVPQFSTECRTYEVRRDDASTGNLLAL